MNTVIVIIGGIVILTIITEGFKYSLKNNLNKREKEIEKLKLQKEILEIEMEKEKIKIKLLEEENKNLDKIIYEK